MLIKVTVVPHAKKAVVIILDKLHLKVRLVSPPIKNRANIELISLLAEHYGVKKSCVIIKTGKHTRKKIVEIIGRDS